MWSSAEIFGAPVTEPPGNVASQELGEADARTQSPLDRAHEVRDAGERALDHELRPAHAARLADAREVVALEVDDHDVLGGVLRRVAQLARQRRPAACP